MTNSRPECFASYSTAVDFVDVSKDGWKPGFKAQYGNYNNKTGYVAVDETTKTYDEHYLIGNFHQSLIVTGKSVAPYII